MVHVFYLLFGVIELLFSAVKLRLGRVKLRFSGLQLRFGLGKAALSLRFALFVGFLCRRKLRGAAVYHVAGCVQLRLPCLYLRIAAVKLGLCFGKLLLIRSHFCISFRLVLTVLLKTRLRKLNIRLGGAYLIGRAPYLRFE